MSVVVVVTTAATTTAAALVDILITYRFHHTKEGQLLAEPRSKVAVEYLLELTGELHLSNVILGATRGGDSSYRWLSNDSIIENPEWGHDAPFPPHKDCDKVVMTNFEGEWAWFSAYNDQKNFNYFCQQSIYG